MKCLHKMCQLSIIKAIKDPSTDHWGTPALTRPESDSSLFTSKNYLLSLKQFLNQIKMSPDIPYDFRFLINPSCQTLSKAFEMSQNIKIVDNRSSKFVHTLWYISNNWYTVEWRVVYLQESGCYFCYYCVIVIYSPKKR
jgi:hypothetical protein